MRKIIAGLTAMTAVLAVHVGAAAPASAAAAVGHLYGPGYQMCATPKGNSTANGTIVTTWTCTGSYLQEWRWENNRIIHNASGKCLTPSGDNYATNGAVLTLWTCNPYAESQMFREYWRDMGEPRAKAYYSDKCITNKGDNLGNGAYLTLWTCRDSKTPSQEWWYLADA
ncbi:RICIN domain-containing protein [Streptomyces sp. NPDC048604]|uniref:RICIN domain-containing protein n=1 Tax=Streptomyces sp. NPDC048604 TaxID=3365578 RepID=UPI003710FED5